MPSFTRYASARRDLGNLAAVRGQVVRDGHRREVTYPAYKLCSRLATPLARDLTTIGDLERRAEEVVALPRCRRQAFVAACAERLWPSYPAFSEMEEWGDPAAVRQVLDELWGLAEGEQMPPERIGELLAILDPLGPDLDDFTGSVLASAALDAVATIVAGVECGREEAARRAWHAPWLVVETLDQYLSLTLSDDSEENINSHPLMVSEFERQEADLRALKSRTEPDPGLVRQLRRTAVKDAYHEVVQELREVSEKRKRRRRRKRT
jgi:uncharacterized protein YjaG (DUF416 family)